MARSPQTIRPAGFSFTTTQALGEFEAGTVLRSVPTMAQYLRLAVNDGEEKGVDLSAHLDDAALVALAKTIPGDNADAEWLRVQAIIQSGPADAPADETQEEPKPETPKQVANRIVGAKISAATKEKEVGNLAARLDNDPELAEIFEKAWTAKEDLAYSAKAIMIHFKDKYGEKEMANWPMPGTQDNPKEPYYSDNPDYFTRPSRRRGGGGNASASWVDLFAEGFRPIRDLRAAIETARKESEKEKGATVSVAEYEELKAQNESRINTVKGKVRLAIAFFHNWRAAQDYPGLQITLPNGKQGCGAEYIKRRVPDLNENGERKTDKQGRPAWRWEETTAERCIWLTNPEAEKASEMRFGPYTIQAFCNFDFDAAYAAGGTFQNLLDTVKRDAEAGPGWRFKDVSDVLHAISEFQLFIRDKASRLAFTTEIDDDTDDNNEVLSMMAEVQTWLTDQLSGTKRDRLDAYLEKKREGAKIKAA